MRVKQVLILSDDAHTQAWLLQALDKLDVSITAAPTSEARTRITREDWNLIVLDVGMDPHGSVSEVESSATEGGMPKMLLVAEHSSLDRLRMPSFAQADFFVRGASSEELMVRARSLLWPGEEVGDNEIIRIDDLTVNLATYQAYIGRQAIDFAYLEYALFAFLLTHPGRTHTREALLKRVWGTDYYGGSRTVDVHIRRIRAKIGPELSRRLKTVRNVGYLWER